MGSHLIDGKFQSDKYPTTPLGCVPLKCTDVMAQDLLWEYARRRRSVDAEFSDDLETALKNAGYRPPIAVCFDCQPTRIGVQEIGFPAPPFCARCGQPCTGGHWVEHDNEASTKNS